MNKNPYLKRLQELVFDHSKGQISDDQVVDALHLLSATWGLKHVALIARRFCELLDNYPELSQHPLVDNLASKLKVWRVIADLPEPDDQEREAGLFRYRGKEDSAIPNHPFTGDSPASDALMILAQQAENHPDYERLTAWFVWLALGYKAQHLPLEVYKRYICHAPDQGSGGTNQQTVRLKDGLYDGRLARAFLEVRDYASEKYRGRSDYEDLASLDLKMDVTNAERLTLIALGPEAVDYEYWSDKWGLNRHTLFTSHHTFLKVLGKDTRITLRTLWGAALNADPVETSGHNKAVSKIREIQRPKVRVYTGYAETRQSLQELDQPDLNNFELYKYPKVGDEDLIDDDEIPVEPIVSFVVADDMTHPIRAFFAAKGARTRIEYANALLTWKRSRISRQAQDVLLARLRRPGSDCHGRLLIATSYLFGVSFELAATLVISDAQLTDANSRPLILNLSDGTVRLFTGQPELKKHETTGEIRHTHSETLVFPLVELLQRIANECVAMGGWRSNQRPKYRRQAREIVADFDHASGISELGIQDALLHELLALGHGDLGLCKVITNRSSLNWRNIVHYASYSHEYVLSTFANAQHRLLNPHGTASLEMDAPVALEDVYFGAFDAFNKAELQKRLSQLYVDYDTRQQKGDLRLCYNLLVLHTLLMLNLTCAGRASLDPVPVVILNSRWALIWDKRRSDGSTDRLVPLPTMVVKQLEILHRFSWQLAVTDARMKPLARVSTTGLLQLYWFSKEGEPELLKPSLLKTLDWTKDLPGNWGRKFVRSYSQQVPGRVYDAALGHSVVGRHAWRMTSSFSTEAFARTWIKLQEQIFNDLGLKVLPAPVPLTGRAMPPVLPITAAQMQALTSSSANSASAPTPIVTLERLKELEPNLFAYLSTSENNNRSDAALALAKSYIHSIAEKDEVQIKADATELCRLIRDKFSVPIFESNQQVRMAQDWVLSSKGLINLAYFEEVLLPNFRRDLEELPEREGGCDIASKRRGRNRRIGEEREIGRVIMLSIWHLGLLSYKSVENFLYTYATRPILVTGKLRYLMVRTPCRRTGELMQRCVFLDAYTKNLLLLEHDYLAGVINTHWNHFEGSKYAQRDRRRWLKNCVNSYLQGIGVDLGTVSIETLFEAASQQIMLTGGPLLSAYCRGEFYTEDLGDSVMRRLSGLAPRKNKVELKEEFRNRPEVEQQFKDSKEETVASVIKRELDYVRQLSTIKSRRFSEMERRWFEIEKATLRKHPQGLPATLRLIFDFAQWQINRSIQDAEEEAKKEGEKSKVRQEMGKVQKRNYRRKTEIVGHTLLGYASGNDNWHVINEDILLTLSEMSEGLDTPQYHRMAWVTFYQFLLDIRKGKLESMFVVQNIGNNFDKAVSANILSVDEYQRIQLNLGSARSNMGSPIHRVAGSRLIDLAWSYGFRRSESEFLRDVDVQGELIRVVEWGEHTLKTNWSRRIVPTCIGSVQGQELVRELAGDTGERLIEKGQAKTVRTQNFYDRLNKLMKRVTGDQEIHLHHFRHTLASRLFLSVMSQVINVRGLKDEIPWLEPMLLSDDQLDTLLGGEGPFGHGIQANSAVLGHSHPTTTLRHYIHLVCIAFRAWQRDTLSIDMTRSFHSRLTLYKSARTAQRLHTQIRAESDEYGRNALISGYIEKHFGSAMDVDEQPLELADNMLAQDMQRTGTAQNRVRQSGFDALELLAGEYREQIENDSLSPEYESLARAMADVAGIPSGKKGNQKFSRHRLEELNGCFVPESLPSGNAATAAEIVFDWLQVVQEQSPEDFEWLLQKFLYASEYKQGLIRLSGHKERKRIERLVHLSDYVEVGINSAEISNKRRTKDTHAAMLADIYCVLDTDEEISPAPLQPEEAETLTEIPVSDNGMDNRIPRAVKGFRWSMIWVAAIESAGNS